MALQFSERNDHTDLYLGTSLWELKLVPTTPLSNEIHMVCIINPVVGDEENYTGQNVHGNKEHYDTGA